MEISIDKVVQKNLKNIFEQFGESMLDKGLANPFYEKWNKGRPTFEQLIRRDFYRLWQSDNLSKTHPFLHALTQPSITPITQGHPVRIKFIQRGSC